MSTSPGHEPEGAGAHEAAYEVEQAIEEVADTVGAGGSGRASSLASALVEDGAIADALGGWRGMIDSVVPSAVFLIAFTVTGRELGTSVWAAVIAGAAIAVWRLIRRQPLQQVVGGFVGVALCAWLASRTGRAEDFYLPGLLWNVVTSLVLAVSAIVGRPVVGYLVGAITGDLTGWRDQPILYRAYQQVSWLLAAAFALRVVVQAPLYLAGWVEALGVARLAMGLPLYAGALALSFVIVQRARARVPVPDPAPGESAT